MIVRRKARSSWTSAAEARHRPVQLIPQHPETAVDPRMPSQTPAKAGEVPQRLLDDLGIQNGGSRVSARAMGGELQRFCIA